EARGPQERADWKGAMPQVQRSRTNLEEQRRHDEEIVAAHQDDFDVHAASAKPLQVAGSVISSEAAAEYQDPSLRGYGHVTSPRRKSRLARRGPSPWPQGNACAKAAW